VPALVTGNGNSLCIFFDSTFNDVCNTSVMTKMNDLGTFGLQDPAHDIDGRIMPVEQTGGGYNSDFIDRCI
jgi:hypothetical protein